MAAGMEFQERALQGGRWLAGQQQADGSWAGLADQRVDGFYKGAWALMLTGQSPAAQRLLNYTQTTFLGRDGDFNPRENIWHVEVHYLYANAYFIIGSMLAGRYEIAVPALNFLLTQQATNGGFYSERTIEGQHNPIDTVSTSAAGLACLAGGAVDAARRAGDFLVELARSQPEPNDRFYAGVEADGTLMTDFSDPTRNRCRMVDASQPNQCWYAVGLPFGFAVQLHQATGDLNYRELAHWLFEFQKKCANPWAGGSSGKSGWACSMLYRMTGQQEYRDIALEIAGFMGQRQSDDGSWGRGSIAYGQPSKPEGLTNGDYDLTSEYTLWLALIAGNIVARDGE